MPFLYAPMSFLSRALCLLSLLSIAHTLITPATCTDVSEKRNGESAWTDGVELQSRTLNRTLIQACKALQPSSKVHYVLSPAYTSTVFRYISSTSQSPTCVFLPTTPSEIASALDIVQSFHVPFAVSSGRHASNVGFSSTKGIQIDMKGFQHVRLSDDRAYVDVGTGNVWDNVYQVLEGTGVNIVGGRVTGVGVGGFITGGGGYSWKTNQYGLTSDTLIQADLVLPNGTLASASETQNSDLFWAIKGGGNQFGIVYNWRLETVSQPARVYGGLRTYTKDQIPAIVKATAAFSANSTDPKAQVIATFNTLLGIPGISLLGFYDGPDPGTSLSRFFDQPATAAKPFTDGWKQSSFSALVRSSPANATAGTRGLFHTVTLQSYSLAVVEQIANQSAYWGSRPLRSAFFISYDVEPFLRTWSDGHAKDAAYPHANNPLPLNLYFAWTSPLDDDFYRNAIIESANLLTDLANKEGQNLDQFQLYPNYAISGTPAVQLFGQGSGRLADLKQQFDPQNVMGLTTYFDINGQ